MFVPGREELVDSEVKGLGAIPPPPDYLDPAGAKKGC